MKHHQALIALLLTTLFALSHLYATPQVDADNHIIVNGSDAHSVSLSFDATNLNALYDNENRITLPAISKYVVIPPRCGVRLNVNSEGTKRLKNLPPPRSYQDKSVTGLYPAQPVVMGQPAILRGVRMILVTFYPLQYDPRTGEYIHHDKIDVDILFTDDDPVNPVQYTGRRANRSPEFMKTIRSLALNDDLLLRDQPEEDRDHVAHYLIVAHDSCLVYARQFIEWKRKAGYKVDILRYSHEDTRSSADSIKADIQGLYDEYLDQGIDPFDHIVLLGDRIFGDTQPSAWCLVSFRGNSSLPDNAAHADYIYGLLEGDDHLPDVAVGRFGSGTRDMIELAIVRTLSYESSPRLEDSDWFEKAGVFSQRWGPDWTPSLVFTVRWGEQVLSNRGFSEIRIQETDGERDDGGNIIGPVLAEWFNDGMSIMIGRAEIRYWEDHFLGVENNSVFPIFITTTGHGEFAMNNMFRTGNRDNLKGPVAMITGWGRGGTVYNNAIWLGIIKGVMIHDMTLGWGRAFAGIIFPTIFRGMEDVEELRRQYETDTDLYGDPGIQPWIGVPRIVEARFPVTLSPGADHVEITVFLEESDETVSGAQVTLYYPGEYPEPEDYHAWQPEYGITGQTDASGKVRLPLNTQLETGTMFLTVTGRDIYPLREEIEIVEESAFIAISDYSIDDSNGGNNDGNINPGETIQLELTAANFGSDVDVMDVQAIVSSRSPYINITDSLVTFGDIAHGESAQGNESIAIEVHSACPDGCEPELFVDFTSTGFIWRSIIRLDVWGPDLEIVSIEGGNTVSYDARDLNLEVINNGRIDVPEISARLLAQDFNILILDDEANYPPIGVDSTATADGNNFIVSSREFAVPGNKISMAVVFYIGENPIDTAWFNLQLPEPESSDPIGPDTYGYYCYDNSDRDNWQHAPRYFFFEICPDDDMPQLPGEVIEEFEDNPINSTVVLDLPFTFNFYGEEFDRITVGTNGFLGVGDQLRMVNSENYPLDLSIAGPMGMIAPFWSDLSIAGGGDPAVVYYHFEAQHMFIIEWYNVHLDGDDENRFIFQAIIYDEEYHPTATGDNKILFIYKYIQNLPGWGLIPYASVGISSPDGKTGIGYTFRNYYHPAAARLRNRMAIMFTTTPPYSRGITLGTVYDAETDEPLTGVEIKAYSEYGFEAVSQSGDDGEFELVGLYGLPSLRFDGIKQGYRGARTQIDTLGEDTLEVDLHLTHPVIRLYPDELNLELASDHKMMYFIRLLNEGTGPFVFTATLGLLIEDNSNMQSHETNGKKQSENRIRFTDWLDLEPRTGSVNSGDYTTLTLTLDTRTLEEGDYSRAIVIEDELAELSIVLPVYLNVDSNNGLIDVSDHPLEWSLSQNFPNPFNSMTTIGYSIKESGSVRLTIFDLNGRVVARLVDEYRNAGTHRRSLNGADLPNGIYLYQLKAGDFLTTKKMVLIK
ncbi:T9SS type A sorting domain-containing protein [bacterium]|nr:T9SS type A sorting domain-containing protein [bacterium]